MTSRTHVHGWSAHHLVTAIPSCLCGPHSIKSLHLLSSHSLHSSHDLYAVSLRHTSMCLTGACPLGTSSSWKQVGYLVWTVVTWQQSTVLMGFVPDCHMRGCNACFAAAGALYSAAAVCFQDISPDILLL